MDQAFNNSSPLASQSRRFAQRLLAIGGNRLELLMIEVQEERQHLLHTLFLGLGAAALGLLALMAISSAIVVLLWPIAPVLTLFALALLYTGAATFLYLRLVYLQRTWKSLPATLDQLRKDRVCLENSLT